MQGGANSGDGNVYGDDFEEHSVSEHPSEQSVDFFEETIESVSTLSCMSFSSAGVLLCALSDEDIGLKLESTIHVERNRISCRS